jgi:hypothetical protein
MENYHFAIRKTGIKITINFSLKKHASKKEWSEIFSVERNKYQTRVLYIAKLVFRMEREI